MSEGHKYKSGVLGGTFDNFHKGHQFFIDKAFEIAEMITIGITTDEFVNNKTLSNTIEPFEIRKVNLKKYLEKKGYHARAKIIPISDIYGSTLTDEKMQVIFVTNETLKNAKLVNIKRQEIGFNPLGIIEIEIKAGDEEKIISSSRIRKGEIDTNGTTYIGFFRGKTKLILLEEFRHEFKKPIGEIVNDSHKLKDLTKKVYTIAIGDIVTSTLISIGKTPNLSIFDLKTKREIIEDEEVLGNLPKPVMTLENQPGTINCKTAIEIDTLIKKALVNNEPYSIKIIGEEDLLTIPAILFAPLNSIVIYGLRDIGAVVAKVTLEKKKEIIENYLNKFY